MDRIYESSALERDDDEPFAPNERDLKPRAMRSVPAGALSRLFVPHWLQDRAISVSVSTPREVYPDGADVPFVVTMKNSLPLPVTIETRSPLLWSWEVDGVQEASHVSLRDPPDQSRTFQFDRGERKQFRRRWHQLFKVTDDEWEPAGPGEYTIGAGINVENPAKRGLYGETTVRIEPE